MMGSKLLKGEETKNIMSFKIPGEYSIATRNALDIRLHKEKKLSFLTFLS